MDAPTNQTTAHTNHPLETYSPRGLLAYAAVVPVFGALLAAPGAVLAFALGALTAVLLNSAPGLV